MRIMAKAALCALALALVAPAAAHAQEDDDLLDRLRQLARTNGELYIQPVTEGLGLALNQGTLFTARPHRLLTFEVGLAISGSIIPDEKDQFQPVLPTQISFRDPSGQTHTLANPYGPSSAAPLTPTASGSGSGALIPLRPAIADSVRAFGGDPAQFELQFPEGFDIPAIPFAVLQGSAGLPLGTEVSIRMIPEIELADEVGSLSAFGFGLKHSISQYIPGAPLDASVMFNRQSLDVGTYLEGSATSFGLAASRGLGPLTLFAAATRETGSVDVSYTFDGVDGQAPETIRFETDIPSTTRLTGGATLSLLWLKLSGAYSVADYNGFALKALLSFP